MNKLKVRLKAWMFNRKASSPKNKPDQILETLALQPGQHIADIGAGGGYFSMRFAEAVGDEGLVYAVDTNQGFLDILRENSKKKGLKNIKTIPAHQAQSKIPEKSLDYFFLRNVYHHLQNRIQYFGDISPVLKHDGKVVIIEYNGKGRLNFHKLFGHYVPQEKIIEEMREAGYKVDNSFDFLPQQSFMIFSLKKLLQRMV